MNIKLFRVKPLPDCSIGKLSIEGDDFTCYTLERRAGEDIPAGRYKITVDYSPRFQCQLPLVNDVPGYVGIRIHPGNTDKDTHGCILTGQDWAGQDYIYHSRLTFECLFDKIKAALENEEDVWLEIS